MSRGQWVLALVGILIVGLFAHEWYSRNSVETDHTPSPMAQAVAHPAIKVANAKPAHVEIKNYKKAGVGQYQFNINYTAINTGDEAAENIVVHIHPWVDGDYQPDHNGMQIDRADPINKQGKDDYIQRLESKQSVNRTVLFDSVKGFIPSTLSTGVSIDFKPAGSPH